MSETTTHFSFDSNPETIQDYDPAVVVDINLGKNLEPGQVLNVAYQGLRDTLGAHDTPLDNSKLLINFVPRRHPEIGKSEGIYFPDDKEMFVEVNHKDLDRTQDVLEHELQHYVDDIRGHYAEESTVRRGLYGVANMAIDQGRKILALSYVAAGSFAAVAYQSRYTENPAFLSTEQYESLLPYAGMASVTSTLAMLGGLALARGYTQEPGEVRAREAEERISLPPTVTIE
jgi:hypothetical protein